MNLHERTVHWGYIAIGILFTRMLPFPIDLSMNILAAFLGAVGISATFLICYKLTEDVLASYFSAGILLSSKTFFENSVFTDVYQAQTVFIMLALLFWLYQKSDILAAMFFLVAQLINPTTIVAAPLFFIDTSSFKNIAIKRIAKFVLYILPIYAIFLYIYWNDLWYSSRGVSGVTSGIYRHFPFFWRLRDTVYHIFYDSNFIIIPVIIGSVWMLFLRNYLFNKYLGLIAVVFLGLIFSAPDNWFPKMQVCFPWLSIIGGILFTNLRNVSSFKHKHIYSILLIIIGMFFVFSTYRNVCDIYENKTSNELFKRLCRDVNGIIKKDCFVVSDWSKGMLYERYNFNTVYTGKVVYLTQPDFETTVLNKNICILDQKTKGFVHEKFKIPLKEVRLQSGIVWFNKKIN